MEPDQVKLTKDEAIKRELQRKSLDSIKVLNITSEDYIVYWDKYPHRVPANSSAVLPRYIATKYVKEMTDKMQQEGKIKIMPVEIAKGVTFIDAVVIVDEFQDMDEEAWTLVGAPMLLDNNGDAVFIYTKKRGKNHADNIFKRAAKDETGRWKTFVFSSHDNPYLSKEALSDITGDMTQLAYRMEILAEDLEDDPRALWNRDMFHHVTEYPALHRIVVGVDPSGSTTGNECGIVAAGIAKIEGVVHGYIIADKSKFGSSAQWGTEAVATYNLTKADRIIGEVNDGGDMVENTIRTVEGGKNVSYKSVRATRGKAVRAEPIQALYEQGRVHHVGEFTSLEDEQCNWVPGDSTWSPNRLDAAVWALTELMLEEGQELGIGPSPTLDYRG